MRAAARLRRQQELLDEAAMEFDRGNTAAAEALLDAAEALVPQRPESRGEGAG